MRNETVEALKNSIAETNALDKQYRKTAIEYIQCGMLTLALETLHKALMMQTRYIIMDECIGTIENS